MLYLAAYQGLRAVEIAGLRRENVHDLDDPPHLVVLGKGNKERVLPLQPRVLAELQAYGLPRRGSVFTMFDNTGRRTTRPITAARVSAACGAYLAEARTGATLHALRHFFATALYQTTQDLRLVQEALGHTARTSPPCTRRSTPARPLEPWLRSPRQSRMCRDAEPLGPQMWN